MAEKNMTEVGHNCIITGNYIRTKVKNPIGGGWRRRKNEEGEMFKVIIRYWDVVP